MQHIKIWAPNKSSGWYATPPAKLNHSRSGISNKRQSQVEGI